jgi:predicted nucleic acid-binding Zn ribbon protein
MDGDGCLAIGEATKRLLRARGLGNTVLLGQIMEVWDEVVGPVVATHAQPSALEGGQLVVEVYESAWSTEVQFLSASILERLSERLGEDGPRDLRPRVTARRRQR